ncbi:MAG: sulfurtransferase TusA family protein [Sphaerochaetaceae bacterium]
MITVDARGLSCPQPVIETKKALASAPQEAVVIVDNVAAKENVTRYAGVMGYEVAVSDDGDGCRLSLRKR